ncbi:hypothetical protein [Acidovorax sp. SDU_ACID1]|uniref:hypothetical protein n=1 Tax=Acidovorax sp. SDU_ACID1 TaxID=3136632 RepID=UPI0038737435
MKRFIIGIVGGLLALGAHSQIWIYSPIFKNAGMYELDDCRVPEGVKFARFYSSPHNQTKVERYVKFRNEVETYKMVGTPTAKNPEKVIVHGPTQTQKCTTGADPYGKYQSLSFKLRTWNFYSTPTGNHIAMMMRGAYSNMDVVGQEQYTGAGLALFGSSDPGGSVMGEYFRHPGGNYMEPISAAQKQFKLNDGVTYQFNVHSAPTGISYSVTNTITNEVLPWHHFATYDVNNPSARPMLFDSGMVFAVLCNDGVGASCMDGGGEFSVDIWDIHSGWFTP